MGRGRAGAGIVATVVVAQAVAALSLTLVVGWSFTTALDAFVVSNGVLGVSFGACGAFVAWHRPGNPVGWLLAVAGVLHLTTAVGVPLQQVLLDADAPLPLVRGLGTLTVLAWPWSISVCLPLFLLLYPDGRLVSPRWRWAVVLVVATAPLFVAGELAPDPLVDGLPLPYLTLADHADLAAVWTVGEVRTLAALLLGLVALALRYARQDGQQRLQILWLTAAVVVVLAFIIPWSLVAGTPVVVLFSIPLVPAAVAVAVVRHQLLDIRPVLASVLVWALLSALVVVAYVVLVGLLDAVVSERLGRSAAATVLIALVAAPALPRLRHWVDRRVYGDRDDPARVISQVGAHLTSDAEAGFPAVVASVAAALRLPYVALRAGSRLLGEAGSPSGASADVPLTYGGQDLGTLEVGLRPGERSLSATDRDLLRIVGASLAVAVRATLLADEVRASRDRLVAAREDERSRLRRDLHDGLGPHLTGVAMKADAARNLMATDAALAEQTLAALATDTRSAITEVRRVVDGLRPAALDGIGLADALRAHVEGLAASSPVHVTFESDGPLPALPRAVEVAAYRVATEALHNVVRHAGARTATIRLLAADDLGVEVTDDGAADVPWVPGVGLQTMAARAAELGGTFVAGPQRRGGRVMATFPLEVR